MLLALVFDGLSISFKCPLAKSMKNSSIWLLYVVFFSQIELKSIDLAKESLASSNIYLINQGRGYAHP